MHCRLFDIFGRWFEFETPLRFSYLLCQNTYFYFYISNPDNFSDMIETRVYFIFFSRIRITVSLCMLYIVVYVDTGLTEGGLGV